MEIHKRKISAKIVADSIDCRGNRITTFVLTYPRIIHAEIMTHRLFSRNAASSRAIPFNKMVKSIEEDPFIPIAWQKDHKGMQGTEYFTNERISNYSEYLDGNEAVYQLKEEWLGARNCAIEQAKNMNQLGLTKQLCNRLLEPFQWYTCLVTATEFDNFYELRCPKYYYESENKYFKSKKDYSNYWFECFGSRIEEVIEGDPVLWWLNINHSQAEIHIQAIAEAMWDAQNESKPKELKSGEWHIPFGDRIVEDDLLPILYKVNAAPGEMAFQKVKIATARCARLSYMTFDGEIDYIKDISLHNNLYTDKHMSPFEHCARCMDDIEYESFHKGQFVPSMDKISEDIGMALSVNSFGWCNNFRGFIQYKYLIENGNFRTHKSI